MYGAQSGDDLVDEDAPLKPVTPYAERALAGVVRSTWLRGRRITGDEPLGTLISRGEA